MLNAAYLGVICLEKNNMELRKEVESLALWYIPAFVVVALASSLYSGYVKDLMELGEASPGVTLSLLSALGMFINLVDNVVVGVWLYVRGRKDGGRAILWLLFGAVAHFYAALLYLGLKIYEQQKAYNKSLQPTEESGG